MRRFHILDGLLLTATLAAAFALHHWLTSVIPRDDSTLTKVMDARTLAALTTMMVTWTLSLLVLLDRPRRSDALNSPGKIAVIAIAVASVASIVMSWEILFRSQLPVSMRVLFLPLDFISQPSTPACLVVCSWAMLYRSRAEKPKSDWLNTAGIIVGATWIAFAITHPLLDLEVMRRMGWEQ